MFGCQVDCFPWRSMRGTYTGILNLFTGEYTIFICMCLFKLTKVILAGGLFIYDKVGKKGKGFIFNEINLF